MKLLADENLDRAIVHWLREQGHDVVWAAEVHQQADDDQLLLTANAESRIIITADLDFGEMIFRQKLSSHGILLLRLHLPSQSQRLAVVQSHWPAIESHLPAHFVVMTEHRIRVRPLHQS
jgi:predicted nuclease of predicted toxin-antitoxin system